DRVHASPLPRLRSNPSSLLAPCLKHWQPHTSLVHLHTLLTRQRALGRFFLFPLVDLFEQGIDHLAFENVADDLTALEDDTLAFAGGDAQVGLACLARSIDHAT